MSKKAFKSQASSSRAVSGIFRGAPNDSAFGTGAGASSFGAVASSPLSYVYEPPDLSGFSEPNVGVAYKNLQKKDGTTKAKALDEIQEYVSSLRSEDGGLEDSMLEAWIKLYPRISIDSSRRVRQLAHTLHGEIAASCGKRIAKYMPSTVASWLAGLYDNDKSVCRAANAAYQKIFNSEEKRNNIWHLYQVSVIEYSQDVIITETANSLSDERSVSPDDASAKYSRVAGAAIMILNDLLEKTPSTDLERSRSSISGFLNEDKVWKLASSADPFIRRAVYRLLVIAVGEYKDVLNPGMISGHVLTSGLTSNQSGSAYDYAKAISSLSIALPDVWTIYYTGTGKKSAHHRVCQFLKRGSQGGPPEFWSQALTLLKSMPEMVLRDASPQNTDTNDDTKSFSSILSALHDGLGSKDEARANQAAAWNTYLEVSELVCSSFLGADDHDQFYRTSVLPMLAQYIRPLSEKSSWTVAGPEQRTICCRAALQALTRAPRAFEEEWRGLSARIIEDIRTSLPEQSKEYTKSQESLATETERWYRLQACLLEDQTRDRVRPILQSCTPSEVLSALSTLEARNGKPYSAAISINNAISQAADIVLSDTQTKETLVDFMNTTVTKIILSPSAKYLVRLFSMLEDKFELGQGLKRCMQTLMDAPESTAKSVALEGFVASSFLATTPAISSVLTKKLDEALTADDDASWDPIMAAIGNPVAPNELTDDILSRLAETLSITPQSTTGLRGLEMAVNQKQSRVRDFTVSKQGSSLLSKLLLLSDSPNSTLSQRAGNLCTLLEPALVVNGGNDQAAKSMIEIIRDGFLNARVDSLSIDALVSQAQKLLEQAFTSVSDIVAYLLPDTNQWDLALLPIILRSPNTSLAVTNPFGGALYLIPRASSPLPREISRDSGGCSSAVRMVRYTIQLIKSTDVFNLCTVEQKADICKYIALFLQLAGDDLSVPAVAPLWITSDQEVESEFIDFIAESQTLLASWLHKAPLAAFVTNAANHLAGMSSRSDALSYYSARSFSAIATEIVETHGGHGITDAEIKRLRELRTSSEDIFTAIASFISITDAPELLRLCNGLLADITGQDLPNDLSTGADSHVFKQLLLMNSLFYRPEKYVDEVPKQRLVFFVKHMVEQLKDVSRLPPGIGAEILKALVAVLPAISDIYGSFWQELLDLIPRTWEHAASDENVYTIYCSLRLLSVLTKANLQRSNDDLLDAWAEKQGSTRKALVALMISIHDISDETHQPRRIVNELISRQLSGLSQDNEVEAEDLYPVLASESAALQQATYKMLHSHIPRLQEQISLDKALSRDIVAELPLELLSLILAPPSTAVLAEHNFERTMAPSLRSYLLSWQLTFDHWQNASYKVQGDYVAALKEGTYVKDFLSFALNILITARTRPIDASKFDIESYTPDIESSPERESHWLLIHLYYLALRYLPTLTKEWWRDSAPRQLNIALEPWTEKYMSPLIIARELSTIAAWAPSQATDDHPMTIKTSLSTREITASIPVDEQTMSISVRLAPSYPLARAEVKSIHRVGVVEKKWQSWLMISQGVMNLSSGSAGEGNALIDGLIAWRKNVAATMKGQAECAICYSVVSSAKELPGKRCSTCKNSFHSSCLFRWFKSSNSSSCPLCRNAFHYG